MAAEEADVTTVTEETVQTRPKEPVGPKLFRWGITLVILIPAVLSAMGLSITWERIASAPGEVWRLVRLMIPPEVSPEVIQRSMPKVMESLFIAWIGTLIAAVISLVLAVTGARNIAKRWVSGPIQGLFILIRAVPELLLAMVLIPITGLGPLTAVLAIGIHSIGTLGKLTAEAIEGIDQGPVEAMASVGGGKLAQIRFGALPQVMPVIVAYWLYRFEVNIRASAVLGAIGAGGIGLELVQQMQFRNWPRVATVLILTIIVVLSIDLISARLRRRIITGRREPGPVAVFRSAGTLQRIGMMLLAIAGAAVLVFILVMLQTPPENVLSRS
nr:MAG: phosphonate ABC transporter, permease protein PhnE [Actinomycetota bacterium]